ncbi:MAG: NYN domain-containing protein [Treponema sp.]|nr:NYN domain-containing protein [Treponema sp.]
MSDTKIKARLYIDGNFTFHIHSYLVKNHHKTIDWKSFQEHVKSTISEKEGKACTLESDFFVGTGLETTDTDEDKERVFLYNSMEHENIIKHATPLKKKVTGGLKEDAVDTNLVFCATKDYYKYEGFDYLVLLAGDSDFVPLLKGLKAEAVKIFLIYIKFVDKSIGMTQVSQNLLDLSDFSEDINSWLTDNVKKKLFQKRSEEKESNTIKESIEPIIKEESVKSSPINVKDSEFAIHKRTSTAEMPYVIHKKQPSDIHQTPVIKSNVEVKKKTNIEKVPEPKIVVVKRKTPFVETKPIAPPVKPKIVVVKKQTMENEKKKDLPFTIDDLEKAILQTQQAKCNGHNDFVLVAQVGENLKGVLNGRLHGKFYNMIKKNFPDDFEFDLSEKSAPMIRFKM